MRTTIDLPQDLHRVLSSLAATNHKSLSQTAVEVLQRGLSPPPATAALRSHVDSTDTSSTTGLPQVHFDRVITPEDIKALDDQG